MPVRKSENKRGGLNFTLANYLILDHIMRHDMDFICYNSPTMSVMEYVSFTVAETINSHLDSNSATAFFTHLTLHLSSNKHRLLFN